MFPLSSLSSRLPSHDDGLIILICGVNSTIVLVIEAKLDFKMGDMFDPRGGQLGLLMTLVTPYIRQISMVESTESDNIQS